MRNADGGIGQAIRGARMVLITIVAADVEKAFQPASINRTLQNQSQRRPL